LQRGDPQTPGVSCDEISTITSDVYKSSGLTTRRHVPLGPSTEIHGRPGGYHRQWQRAEGDAGKSIVFILRYRSRVSNRCPSSLLLDRTNFPVEALGALDIIDVNTEEPGIESELNNTIPNQSLGIQDIIGQDTRVKVEPDMSSTPSEDSDIPNRSPSKGPAPEPSSPSQMVSLLSDDEDCYKPATQAPRAMRRLLYYLTTKMMTTTSIRPPRTLRTTTQQSRTSAPVPGRLCRPHQVSPPAPPAR
jgi:hypothetical protein